MQRSPKQIELAATLGISAIFTGWSAAFIHRSSFIAIDGKRYFALFDDAMISMRYAWNFAHGPGLVWNPGETVQGYTNLLMTLFMAVAALLLDKSAAVLAVQVSGAVLMVAVAFTTSGIAGKIAPNLPAQHQSPIRVLVFAGALAYYPLAYWSLMGMETGLLTLLLLLGTYYALDYTDTLRASRLLWVAVFLGLAGLTRNDSTVFALLIWTFLMVSAMLSGISIHRLWPVGAAFALYALFHIGQMYFQLATYGEWLPNTYTLKLTGMPLTDRVRSGVGFVLPFLIEIGVLLPVVLIGLVLRRTGRKLLLAAMFAASLAYQIYVGGDPWAYWRIMSPTMPLLVTLFVTTLYEIITSMVESPLTPRAGPYHRVQAGLLSPMVLVTMLTVVGLMVVNLRFVYEIALISPPYQKEANLDNVNTAIALTQVTTPDATVGVYWAGAIPYYSGLRAIDFLGKSDRYIANLPPDVSGAVAWSGMKSVPGHNKYDLDYSIKTLLPTYVQGFNWGSQDLTEWADARYRTVSYLGVTLNLLTDSPYVLWYLVEDASGRQQ